MRARADSLLGKSSGHGEANVYTNAHTFHGTDELRRKYRLSEREVEEYLSPLLTTGGAADSRALQ